MSKDDALTPWPSAHELQLLKAALLPEAEAVTAWQRFCACGPGIERVDYAGYRVLPQLFRNLQRFSLTQPDAPASPEMGRLRGVYRHAWYANQQLLHEGAAALAALQHAGIQTMLLKGAALLAVYEPDVGVRPMDDLDLLVKPADAARALHTLEAAGWRQTDRPSLAQQMRVRHALALENPRGASLDLHWSALFPRSCDEQLWADAVPTRLRGVATLAPSGTDQLLLVCAHGLGWSPAPLRWITDAMLILRSAGEHLDWTRLVARARIRHVSLAVADALAVLEREFRIELPAEVLAALRRGSAPADRVAHRIKVTRPLSTPWRKLVFHAAWRWDAARQIAAAPALAVGHPRGPLSYLQEEWDLPNRRAALLTAARKAAGMLPTLGAS